MISTQKELAIHIRATPTISRVILLTSFYGEDYNYKRNKLKYFYLIGYPSLNKAAQTTSNRGTLKFKFICPYPMLNPL